MVAKRRMQPMRVCKPLHKGTAKFHPFMRLPAEIRLIIWKMKAIETRAGIRLVIYAPGDAPQRWSGGGLTDWPRRAQNICPDAKKLLAPLHTRIHGFFTNNLYIKTELNVNFAIDTFRVKAALLQFPQRYEWLSHVQNLTIDLKYKPRLLIDGIDSKFDHGDRRLPVLHCLRQQMPNLKHLTIRTTQVQETPILAQKQTSHVGVQIQYDWRPEWIPYFILLYKSCDAFKAQMKVISDCEGAIDNENFMTLWYQMCQAAELAEGADLSTFLARLKENQVATCQYLWQHNRHDCLTRCGTTEAVTSYYTPKPGDSITFDSPND